MLISPIIIPGVIGAAFAAYDKPFIANIIWVFSNFIMSIRSYYMGDFTNCASYLIFQAFALWGVVHHVYISRKTKIQAVQ